MTRVLLVDDHASSRQALAFLLEREPGISAVDQAGSVAEARQILAGGEIDVAVLDLGLPDGDGADLVPVVRSANPDAQALILSGQTDRRHLARAVATGAAGILPKLAPVNEVVDAVRRLGAGEAVIHPEEMLALVRQANRERGQDAAAHAALDRLTAREREVLQALAEGLSDKEIAHRFNVSEKTVRTHMVNLLAKLGVDSRLQALVFALRYGAVEIR
jgi:RNA polymerase sigma factor (sigma-70 family)